MMYVYKIIMLGINRNTRTVTKMHGSIVTSSGLVSYGTRKASRSLSQSFISLVGLLEDLIWISLSVGCVMCLRYRGKLLLIKEKKSLLTYNKLGSEQRGRKGGWGGNENCTEPPRGINITHLHLLHSHPKAHDLILER